MGSREEVQILRDKILGMYEKGLSRKNMIEILKIDLGLLHYHIKKLGLITHIDTLEVKRLYDIHKDIHMISEILTTSYTNVAYHLSKAYPGISLKDEKISRILTNEDYFEYIDEEGKAYFLGLIASDGCLPQKDGKPTGTIDLCLHSQDEYILEVFRSKVGYAKSIKHRERGETTYSRITFVSHKMVSDLIKLDVTPAKSLVLPNILYKLSDEMKPHYIRGMIDGDGGVYLKYSAKYKIPQLTIGFTGTLEVIKGFQDYLGVTGNVYLNPSKSGQVYNWVISRKKEVYSFYEKVYKNATIALPRKLAKFKEAYEPATETTQSND